MEAGLLVNVSMTSLINLKGRLSQNVQFKVDTSHITGLT